MLATRLIAVILVHQGNVVQTRNFKIRNVVGSAKVAVDFFSEWQVDELILLDISPEPDPNFTSILERATETCFVPITVGGHVKTLEDAKALLRCGADKICINTAAHHNRLLIRELALHLGSQCVVLSVDAIPLVQLERNSFGKKVPQWSYTYATHRGTQIISHDLIKFIQEAQDQGCGEILLNSINHDGTTNGYDLELIQTVSVCVRVPLIAMGGAYQFEHFPEAIKAGADACAAANIFHHTEQATIKAKRALEASGIRIRPIEHP